MEKGIIKVIVLSVTTWLTELTVVPKMQDHDHLHAMSKYNYTYPLTRPEGTEGGTRFQIAVISDLDTLSKDGDKASWVSHMKFGHLTVSKKFDKVTVTFDDKRDSVLKSNLAAGNICNLN